MSEALPTLATTAGGAEEESVSVLGTTIAQIITLVRNIINYVLEYMRKFVSWAGEHPLATILFITNFSIWVS